MLLRQLEYLSALARERHFGRAARSCHVSQPALSAAIRKLELELGVPLVVRHPHSNDLTPEGHSLLRWAQQALASLDGMAVEASRLRHELRGTLRLGVIPTALPVVAVLIDPLLARHPGVQVEIRSMSSIELGQQLGSFDLDAGVTYLDNEPLGRVRPVPLYDERYLFLTTSGEPPDDHISWAEAAAASPCLLTRDMQNRRIIDAAFDTAGVAAAPRVETNSITALLSLASRGRPCVMAHTWLALHGLPPGMRALTLDRPVVSHTVGLVIPEGDLLAPMVAALCDDLSGVDVEAELDRGAGRRWQSPARSQALSTDR